MFVVLMLTGGFAPNLPRWPIEELRLQTKNAGVWGTNGFHTDDFALFVKEPNGNRTRKLLGQVKRTVNITNQDKALGGTIQEAWKDYQSSDFKRNEDVITLFTGPLNRTDEKAIKEVMG